MRDYPGTFSSEAFKLTCVSDTHFGRRSFTNNAMNHAGTSLDEMSEISDVFAHVGDVIHWNIAENQPQQDADALAWINNRKTASSKLWKIIGGNHDLASYGVPNPSRTGVEFHAVYGGQPISYVDHENWLRVVFITPEVQIYNKDIPNYEPMSISDNQVNQLITLANDAPERNVYVVFHAPLPSQFSSHMDATNLMDRLEATTNIIGWISGHRHTNLDTDKLAFINFKVKSRLIHHINLPTFGGATPGYTNDRFGQPFISTHISIFKDRTIELRFRDNMQNRWLRWNAKGGQFITTLGTI